MNFLNEKELNEVKAEPTIYDGKTIAEEVLEEWEASPFSTSVFIVIMWVSVI